MITYFTCYMSNYDALKPRIYLLPHAFSNIAQIVKLWQFKVTYLVEFRTRLVCEFRTRKGCEFRTRKGAQSDVWLKFIKRRMKHRAQSWLTDSYRSWWCLKLVDLVHVGMRARNFKVKKHEMRNTVKTE